MRRKTRSTSEAFAILERWREYKLQCGRVLAVRIAQVRGTVHVGLVREALVAEGIVADVPVDEINGPSERWIGPLFIDRSIWEKTGERVPRANRGRNVHGGDTVTVWRLVPGADVSAYLVMPDPPVAAIAEAPEPAAEAGNVVRFSLRVAAEELRAACVGPLGPDATAALAWMLGESATKRDVDTMDQSHGTCGNTHDSPLVGKYENAADADIVGYLGCYPEAVATLLEAHERIVAAFGDRAAVRLNMPDDDDETDTFKARVYVSGMDILEAHARFESEFGVWWYSDPRLYKSRVTFAIGVR